MTNAYAHARPDVPGMVAVSVYVAGLGACIRL